MKPRLIAAGTMYMNTRRTTQGMFLLRPSKEVNKAIRYCVAWAQMKTGVEIHALVFMSNHYHVVVTDVQGNIPLFSELMNGMLARCLNVHHGRSENFWAGGSQTSQVTLDDQIDVLDKTVYTLCNPVSAGLVRRGSHWPGVRLLQPNHYRCKKPAFFFRSEEQGGQMPEVVELKLTRPKSFESNKEWLETVNSMVVAKETEIRKERKEKGLGFMGAKAVNAQAIEDTPVSKKMTRRGRGEKISPRVASKDKGRRIKMLKTLEAFQIAYQECRLLFLQGVQDVVFPYGTYQLKHTANVRVAEA